MIPAYSCNNESKTPSVTAVVISLLSVSYVSPAMATSTT